MFTAHVVATYHGEIIEDRLVLCERPIYIGEGEGVSVSFPGARLRIVAHRKGILVGDQHIDESGVFEWSQHDVTVHVRPIRVAALEREPLWDTDIRFPMLMFAIVLTLLSIQSASQVIATHEDKLPARLASWVVSPNVAQEATTRSNPDFDLGEVARYGVYRMGVGETTPTRP